MANRKHVIPLNLKMIMDMKVQMSGTKQQLQINKTDRYFLFRDTNFKWIDAFDTDILCVNFDIVAMEEEGWKKNCLIEKINNAT